jgi:hypothetical protein
MRKVLGKVFAVHSIEVSGDGTGGGFASSLLGH